MKRLLLVCVFGLLAIAIFANSWTIDGSFDFTFHEWQAEHLSDDSIDFSMVLRLGRYITDNINVGIRTGFGITDGGNSFTLGPYLKYDFYEVGRIYFSVTGSFHYTIFNNSYVWNDFFTENDAHRIIASVAPTATYRINDNVEVYWQFASLLYHRDWLTLKDINVDARTSGLRIRGPFSSSAFGFILRF